MPSQGFLPTARKVFTVLGGLYVGAVVLLTIPYFQTHTLFLHAVKIPFFANYDMPERYGLAPNKTINLKVQTVDNETLGAWFVLSDSFYHSLPTIPSQPVDLIPTALKTHPTILFFHGNAATRALNARIQHYTAFSSRLSANVFAIDYRGYGDSTGAPTQPGVARDARAAWNWLIKNGAAADDILIVGHSLGTGVSALLAAELSDEDISPRGVALLSPFSSISKLLETYSILGVVPLMKPLAMIPWAAKLVLRRLIHTFETDTLVPRIKGPVLIAHAENDWDIPYSHSEALFDAFLDPFLPLNPELPANAASLSQEEWSTFIDQLANRKEVREKIVTSVELRNFGTVHECTESGRKVVFVQTLAGGHDYLGVQEGVQDAIGRTFGLFSR
ncbi:AB hydrolase-1 domain-containing protein [Mycena venus]|uniref:AB hydrolase-1 domain-containing protein n=1 Tax=Mycena venus TaxID=2733690 RepID=A0A8H6YV40_9AGAR|nr:AB hydrolase-1 domain-containing protein [Mycena venus]